MRLGWHWVRQIGVTVIGVTVIGVTVITIDVMAVVVAAGQKWVLPAVFLRAFAMMMPSAIVRGTC